MDSFYRAELEKAPSEQHYGIVDYRVDHEACTSQAAFALVDLLEQRQICVKLSSRGYEVSPQWCSDIDRFSCRLREGFHHGVRIHVQSV